MAQSHRLNKGLHLDLYIFSTLACCVHSCVQKDAGSLLVFENYLQCCLKMILKAFQRNITIASSIVI